jgi:hypothetical protein
MLQYDERKELVPEPYLLGFEEIATLNVDDQDFAS